jgi:hypothetical protein
MHMIKETNNRVAGAEGAAYRQALAQIAAAAQEGLTKANRELTRADHEQDDDNWSLWRGYRRAMLEVLAITERVPGAVGSTPPPSGQETGQ